MSLNNLSIVKGQGGLGRRLPGEDHVSAILAVIDNTTLGTYLTGFGTSDRIKKVSSLEEAEALGIVGTWPDETLATSTWLATNAGATNDTVVVKVVEPTSTVTLGTYKRLSTDTTVDLVAAGVAAIINAGTATHGYTATVSTATVTITARKGLGIYLNSATKISFTITGTVAGTLTDFGVVAGVASKVTPLWYHISEYFRIQPQGELYIGIYSAYSADFAEVKTVQNYSGGKIRQMAVWDKDTAYTSVGANVSLLQTMSDTMETENQPLSILYTANYAAATLSALPTLSTKDSEGVSVVIGQDGFAFGYGLFKSTGLSITNLGAVLGAVSLAKVSESIAWVSKFNLSDGVENDVVHFANGGAFIGTTETVKAQLNTYKYIFMRKFSNFTGSYLNDSFTATLGTSDYAKIENKRTIDKAVRGVRTSLLPELNGPLVLQNDGTLKDTTVAYFEDKGGENLAQMVRDGELSSYSVTVDPDQNVATSSQLIVVINLLPVGVANNIIVKIGFTTSI